MTPAVRRCVRTALASAGLIVALGVAACDLMGGDQLPPKSLLTGLISANDTYDPKGVRLIQLASYFDNGHWRKIGSTTYTLRVSQKDPTSDKTNALGFLIKEVDRPGGETLADITHATLNGDDLTDIEVVNLVNELDLPPIPAGYPPTPGSEPVARPPSERAAVKIRNSNARAAIASRRRSVCTKAGISPYANALW